MERATKVCIYCAPEDEPMLQELIKQLQVLQQQDLIHIWHNLAIQAGTDRKHETEAQFDQSELILLLVSPDFMNAEYGYGVEVQRALERSQQGVVRVIPVILRPVFWQEAPFGKLQALPKGATPITNEKWRHHDDAFYSVVEGIREALRKSRLSETPIRLPNPITPAPDLLPVEPTATVSARFFWKYWGPFCILIGATLALNFVTWLENDPSRLWTFLQRYPLLTIGALLVTGGTPLFLSQRKKISRPAACKAAIWERIEQRLRHMFMNTVISLILPAVTTTLFLGLLLLVLYRPVWCPGFLCAPGQTKVTTYPGGVSDQNLDAYYLAIQSTSFELPGDLQQYNVRNLPRTIAAIRSDIRQSVPYRLVISLQNLHQTGYQIYIDRVTLIVYAIPSLTDPLHVWNAGSLIYNTDLYGVTYAGQPTGSDLQASFEGIPGGFLLLNPGETGDIDLQIDPAHNLQADLKFQVMITYRMANESEDHSLILPNIFEVVFANASNWYPQKL